MRRKGWKGALAGLWQHRRIELGRAPWSCSCGAVLQATLNNFDQTVRGRLVRILMAGFLTVTIAVFVGTVMVLERCPNFLVAALAALSMPVVWLAACAAWILLFLGWHVRFQECAWESAPPESV